MRILAVTSAAIDAEQLRAALPQGTDPADVEVMVLAPAFQESPIKFWMSDADAAIARAERVRRETLSELQDAGVAARAQRGESDPAEAIRDALQTFPADRIVLFTHEGDGQLYREDVDAAELEDRFGVPVVRAHLSE